MGDPPCSRCGGPMQGHEVAHYGFHVAHKSADRCLFFVRLRAEEAEARAFWRGVCAEMARRLDAFAAKLRREADEYEACGEATEAMAANMAAGMTDRDAADLRRWAEEE